MSCGLYGKLPCKRDFVAERVPRDFLRVFEPWLQGAISASRLDLGRRWQEIYGAAPIWRFWLGPAIGGVPVVGAMMPSADGVGRAFPLTVMSAAAGGQTFARPDQDPMDGFFETIEDVMLSALDRDCDYDRLIETLRAVPSPRMLPRVSPNHGLSILSDGMVVAVGGGPSARPFDSMAEAQALADVEAGAVWWTVGGQQSSPAVVYGRSLPAAEEFFRFLTCHFES